MISTQTPLPSGESTVVLVDSSPLIHLAMIEALDLPLRFGPVVVPDAVEIETTHDRSMPYADEIAAWLEANLNSPAAIAGLTALRRMSANF